jgi:hypothetical protein
MSRTASTRRAAVALLATTAAAWRQLRAQPPRVAAANGPARPEPVITHHGGRTAHLTERA